MPNRSYGWQADLPDHRDYKFRKFFRAIPLPPKVDLRAKCSPVEDQKDLGSCTANALVGAVEFLSKQKRQPFQDLSRLFVYYNERAIEGTVSYDSGAQIRDGIKTLAAQGVCAETEWKYQIGKFAQKPPARCYASALANRIKTYYRCNGFADVKQSLAQGLPVSFGFSVVPSFESPEVAKTGMQPMPVKGEKIIGGHAVLAVGYDDTKQMVLVRNSWGAGWGLAGYFWMPYAYISNDNLADDFWTIQV